MEEHFEEHYHNLEESHFWFKARRNYILQLLKDTPRSSRILDVGCSSGLLLQDLNAHGFESENLFGIDISEVAINNCKKNGLKNCYVMSGDEILLDQKFDIIIASDSLEHMEFENKALKNWQQLLANDGKIFIFVPAFKMLWSHHDVVNMHYRRYTRRSLKVLLKMNAFDIVKSGYWNFFLFFPVLLIRKLSTLIRTNKKDASGDLKKLSIFNGTLLALLNFENSLLRFLTFPFGVSTYCIVKNPKNN